MTEEIRFEDERLNEIARKIRVIRESGDLEYARQKCLPLTKQAEETCALGEKLTVYHLFGEDPVLQVGDESAPVQKA